MTLQTVLRDTFGGVFGTVLAYWAMVVVNRSLPAATTSLGIPATPVVGMVSSTLALGETVDASLLITMAMILSGIAIAAIPGSKGATASNKPAVAVTTSSHDLSAQQG